ncbi:NYN domain-containing protein [Bradyrhizobium diazoefficiens]|nr:NYN domain-containing protein [Bradyrhizobium diazoefficiens]QQN62277.1 NYN domain-containing protein [Bradyrhizobium diazoefficiens]
MLPTSSITALFLDGANLHATTAALGIEIDFRRLLSEFESSGRILRAFYYTLVTEDPKLARPLTDWLEYNGYTVILKQTKEFLDEGGRRRTKGTVGVELAVNAMQLAKRIDHMVLFSGDGDLRPLVRAMQRCGVRVTVVSTVSSEPSMVSDELRRQADAFIDLRELISKIGRNSTDRTVPREYRNAKVLLRRDRTAREPSKGEKNRD